MVKRNSDETSIPEEAKKDKSDLAGHAKVGTLAFIAGVATAYLFKDDIKKIAEKKLKSLLDDDKQYTFTSRTYYLILVI